MKVKLPTECYDAQQEQHYRQSSPLYIIIIIIITTTTTTKSDKIPCDSYHWFPSDSSLAVPFRKELPFAAIDQPYANTYVQYIASHGT